MWHKLLVHEQSIEDGAESENSGRERQEKLVVQPLCLRLRDSGAGRTMMAVAAYERNLVCASRDKIPEASVCLAYLSGRTRVTKGRKRAGKAGHECFGCFAYELRAGG
jgi:hypothetical protein